MTQAFNMIRHCSRPFKLRYRRVATIHTNAVLLTPDDSNDPVGTNVKRAIDLFISQRTQRHDDESVWRASSEFAQSESAEHEESDTADDNPYAQASAFISAQTSRNNVDPESTGSDQRREIHTCTGRSVRLGNITSPLYRVRRPMLRMHASMIRNISTTPYSVLGLSSSASRKDIKSHYYDLVKQTHPDRFAKTGVSKEQLDKFHRVVRAYELLSDPKRKSLYDRMGVGWDTPAPKFGQKTRFYRPRTPEEWDAWNAWSDVLRRTAQNGPHNTTWDEFPQGFSRPSPEEQRKRAEEAIPANRRYFIAIFFATWAFGWYQFERLRNRSVVHSEMAGRSSAEIAKHLQDARETARSAEGRRRQQAMLDRVKRRYENNMH